MNKLSKEQQIIFAAVIGFVFAIYFYWTYFMKPINGEIATKQTKYEDLKSQVERAEREARRLPALRSELDGLEVELASLEKQLPTQKDIPGILRILTKEAAGQNIVFQSIRPLEPRQDQYFYVLEFELSVQTTLHAFCHFIASLGQQERIFQVDQVKIGGVNTTDLGMGSPKLTISFQLKTYAYAN